MQTRSLLIQVNVKTRISNVMFRGGNKNTLSIAISQQSDATRKYCFPKMCSQVLFWFALLSLRYHILGNGKELTIFSIVSSPPMGQSLSHMTRIRVTFDRPAPSHNEPQYFEEYINFFGYTVTFIPRELHANGFCDLKHAIIQSIMDPGLLTVYDFRDLGHCLNYRSPIVTRIAEYIVR